MLDRDLISLADDLEALFSRQANDGRGDPWADQSHRLALPPAHIVDRLPPSFLSWHREHCFKH